MQRAFRQAGCQPAGSANPRAATATKYANMSWSEINTTFKDLRNTVKSHDADVQDKATKECLGIKYYRTPIEDSEYGTKLNTDSPGNDIACYTNNEPVSRCRTECTNNANCKGYLEVRPNTGYWGGNGGCCTKFDVVSRLGPYSQLTLRPKNLPALKWYEIAAQGKWTHDPSISGVRTVGIGDTNRLWITAGGPNNIYRKESPYSGGWQNINGQLDQIDAKSNNLVVGYNMFGVVYKWTDAAGWQPITNNNGTAWSSIGADGTICTIAKTSNTYGGGIYRYLGSPNKFTGMPGSLVQISVGDANNIWGVNAHDMIFKWAGRDWQRVNGGLTRVAVSAGGTRVVGISRDGRIWAYNGGDPWTLIPGSLTNISVCQDYIAGVNSTGQLYYLKLA
jgi:hypothetical protein